MQISAVIRDPWETDFAALVPRFTGGISAVSSAVIIYVIVKSETRLSSIYHRIMFGMSLADICGSVAMALTSLPMPSYLPKEEVFGYSWAGARLGNTYTCNAQGFFATFGVTVMSFFNTMLCVYYACAIAFAMKEKNIKKYVEPFLYGIPIAIGLVVSVPPLFYELYNPGISAYAWCAIFTYPLECIQYDYLECIRGDRTVMTHIIYIMLVLVPLVFLIIVISLLLVIVRVIRTERILAKMAKSTNNNTNDDIKQMRLRHGNTKAVLVQAICYISAFLLAFLLPLLRLMGYLFFGTSNDERLEKVHAAMDKAGLICYPLQGFFNCMIFISFKIYNYRRFCPDARICSTLRLLFTSSAQDPAFISRISIVKMDEQASTRKSVDDACYNIDISDEVDDERHYRLGLLYNNDTPPLVPQTPMEVDQDVLRYENGPQNPNLRDEMSFRLGLFHVGSQLDAIDEEYSVSNNTPKSQVPSVELQHSSSAELLSMSSSSNNNNSSSSGGYQFYHGVLEDTKAMQKQLGKHTKDFVNSFFTDGRAKDQSSSTKNVDGSDE